MDFGNLKGRIGEALVENIFHLAGYRVARLGRESDVQRLLKDGEDDFSPDFLVWKPVDGMPGAFWLLNVEVKYRRDLADFFRFGGAEKLTQAKQRWPDLYFVFVTDPPRRWSLLLPGDVPARLHARRGAEARRPAPVLGARHLPQHGRGARDDRAGPVHGPDLGTTAGSTRNIHAQERGSEREREREAAAHQVEREFSYAHP